MLHDIYRGKPRNVYLKGYNKLSYISREVVINSNEKIRTFSFLGFHNEQNKTVFSVRIFNLQALSLTHVYSLHKEEHFSLQ